LTVVIMGLTLSILVFALRVANRTVGLQAVLRMGSLLPLSVLVGLFGAIFTTWYTQSYIPSQRQSNLRVDAELSDLRTQGDQMAVTAKISIRNTGQTRVAVLAGFYWILGVNVHQATLDASQPYRALEKSLLEGRGFRADYVSTMTEKLIQFGEMTGSGIRVYEPGQESTTTVVAHFPKGQFDLIRLTSGVDETNQDRLLLAGGAATGPRVEVFPNGSRAVSRVIPVHEISLVRRLTRGDRELVKRWVIAGPSSTDWPQGTPLERPYARVFLEPKGYFGERTLEPSKQGRLHRTYQVISTGTNFELSLWRSSDKAATTPVGS
jgi:hypothetical protein